MPTLPIATDWTQNPPLMGTTRELNSDPPVDNPPAPDATDLDDQDPSNAGGDPLPTTWTPAPQQSDA